MTMDSGDETGEGVCGVSGACERACMRDIVSPFVENNRSSSSDSVGDPKRSFFAPVEGSGVDTTRGVAFWTAIFAEYLETVSGNDAMRGVVLFVVPMARPREVTLLYTRVVVAMVGSGLGVPERSKGSLYALPKGVDAREYASMDISEPCSCSSSVSVTGESKLRRSSTSGDARGSWHSSEFGSVCTARSTYWGEGGSATSDILQQAGSSEDAAREHGGSRQG